MLGVSEVACGGRLSLSAAASALLRANVLIVCGSGS
jgi:hypothetical protein